MRITRIETTRLTQLPTLLWVKIHTDTGLVGLGETFRGAEAVEAQIHSLCVLLLLSRDPLQIEAHSRALLRGYLGFNGSGVETLAASALDIALWDLFGQALGVPIHQLLVGRVHERMRVYNTCASPNFNTGGEQRRLVAKGETRPADRYDDQVAAVECPGELAQRLVDEGFAAMKICLSIPTLWPAVATICPVPSCVRAWSPLPVSGRR